MSSLRAQVEARTRDAHRHWTTSYAPADGWRHWMVSLLCAHAPFLLEHIAQPTENTHVYTTFKGLAESLNIPAAQRADALIWAYEAWQQSRPLDPRTRAEDLAASTQLFTDAHLAHDLLEPCFDALRRLEPSQLRRVRILDPCSGASAILLTAFRTLVPLFCTRLVCNVAQSIEHLFCHTLRGTELDATCAHVGAIVLALEAHHWLRDDLGAWQQLLAIPSPLACMDPAPAPLSMHASSPLATPPPSKAEYRRIFGSLYNERNHSDATLAAMVQNHPQDVPRAAYAPQLLSTQAALLRPQSGEVAGRWLAERFDHLCTNVPFLARGKQAPLLREFCQTFYPAARYDLANVFLARCVELASPWAAQLHILMPQNWLFLTSYTSHRRALLESIRFERIQFCAEGAFRSASAAGAFVILLHARAQSPTGAERVALSRSPHAGFHTTHKETHKTLPQRAFLAHPRARIIWDPPTDAHPPLSEFADAYVGLQTGDDPRYIEAFWAFEAPDLSIWQPLQNTPTDHAFSDGTSWLIRWEQGQGALHRAAGARPDQGHRAWGKPGVAIQRMRRIFAYAYAGTRFHQNIAVIVPKDPRDLPAIRAFCTAPAFEGAVRQIDHKLNVTNRTLTDVAFDKAHWQRVAEKQDAIRPSISENPHPFRQRNFTGYGPPAHATHIHLARYLGMRWPTEEPRPTAAAPWCIFLHDAPNAPPEQTVSGWLEALHADARRDQNLGASVAAMGDAERYAWLRDAFFEEHCRLFLARPFLWHIWDGTPDGFSVIVRYHQLTHAHLQRLIEAVDAWIDHVPHRACSRFDSDASPRPASPAQDVARLTDAARGLHTRLTQILRGEPPYDLHIRWKPPHAQPTRWRLDLNDGLRVHLRPFLTGPSVSHKGCGILRHRPKVHYRPDRGHDPADGPWAAYNLAQGLHAGARVNDRHRPYKHHESD